MDVYKWIDGNVNRCTHIERLIKIDKLKQEKKNSTYIVFFYKK